jgi:hypothetical protein
MNHCAESNVQSLSMQVHLFGALVAPVFSYCSEGPALLSKGGIGRSSSVTQMLTNPQHVVQFDFLRALRGRLRKSISKLVMFMSLAPNPWHTNGLNLQCASGTRCLIARMVILQTGWCVLAMRENAQLSVSTGIAAHVS